MPENENNIDLRSESVQDILGHIPSWIIRWGITIIFLSVFIVFIGSFFFRYPDIIPAKVTITTINPPVPVVSKVSGKIDSLNVADKQMVKSGEIMAIIENPCNFNQLQYLINKLDSIKFNIYNPDSISNMILPLNLSLGDLQPDYMNLYKTFADFRAFKEMDYYGKKEETLKKQIAENKYYCVRLSNQLKILEKDFNINKEQFKRDSSLYSSGVTSKSDFEKAQTVLLQKKYTFENSKTSLVSSQMSITQLEQQLNEIALQKYTEKNKYETLLKQYYEALLNSIAAFEQQYILKSPIDGVVSFSKIWSKNQQVTTGQEVFIVIPKVKSEIIGKAEIEIVGAGKVQSGQDVNIKLDNFPYMEYGMLQGKVGKISLVPTNNLYDIEIKLTDSLVTNYGKTLPLCQNMQGVAEIVTKDKSIFERLLGPLMYYTK